MEYIVFSFDNTKDAKIMKNYLVSQNASPKIKIEKLKLLKLTILKVKSNLTEREFRQFYNI